MNAVLFTFLVGLGSFLAGLLGSMTGLGGGVVLIPLLSIAFQVDIRYAIGAALVSVIATSSGAAAAYVKEGYTNVRLGIFLELATTMGAVFGALLAGVAPTQIIGVVFGAVLILSALLSHRESPDGNGKTNAMERAGRLARAFRLHGSYPTPAGLQSYQVRHVPSGFLVMLVAGTLSGFLGIGAGAAKVLAMDRVMRIPFKVSTTTSNFMIGVTAAASAGIYLSRGYIDPRLAMPVTLGVILGSFLGSKILVKARSRSLRLLFALVILGLGIEMIYDSLSGRI